MIEQDPMGKANPGVPATPSGAEAKRKWRWLLPVSLAINLLVAGIVGGSIVRHAIHGGGPTMVRDLAIGPYTEALSREDREVLRQSFLSQAGDLRDLRHGGRDSFTALVTALRATPFDLEAVKVLMSDQRDRMAERLHLGQTLLLERIATMTDAERAAFAERLDSVVQRRVGGEKEN